MWKNIKGFEGYYMVSDTGGIKSLDRTVPSGRGHTKTIKGRNLKLFTDKDGYLVRTFCKDSKQYNVKIHRLVAQAFIPNPNNLPQVNHMNGDKTDNRVENLEWCDCLYNIRHARSTGLLDNRGENFYDSKLKNEDVLEIIELRKNGLTLMEISSKYEVGYKAISKIINGDRWSHITGIVKRIEDE